MRKQVSYNSLSRIKRLNGTALSFKLEIHCFIYLFIYLNIFRHGNLIIQQGVAFHRAV